MNVIIPYAPRKLQRYIHENMKRWNILVCHRRFGKTVLAINQLIRSAIENSLHQPRYGYFAPLYRQAKQVAWDYLKYYSAPIPGINTNEAELRVDYPNQARVTLYGCDKPDTLRGLKLDGAVLDEYAMMPPRLWSEVIRPALSDRNGWAMFIGTPLGRNEFHEIYEQAQADPKWFHCLFKASETDVLPQEELDDARRMMTEAQYEQEFECSFNAAVLGAYYGELIALAERENRITSVPYTPDIPVETSWDIGVNDATAIWFTQNVGNELHVIDYYENSGESIKHYVDVLHGKPYTYSFHWAGHDIAVQDYSREDKKTRLEVAMALGILFTPAPVALLNDGIQAVRNILGRCFFDKDKCARGIEALRQYRRKWSDDKKTWEDKPLHDWASHAADAFRYRALTYDPARLRPGWNKPVWRPKRPPSFMAA